MKGLSIDEAADLAKVVSGNLDPNLLTAFAPVRNEIHFIESWLEHHRSVGFEQFLIWDDGSDDGTFEFLVNNSDCVVMQSEYSYRESFIYTDPNGETSTQRLGTVFKAALPNSLLPHRFVGYLDADEFLILPPNVNSIIDVVNRLEDEGSFSALASVIEFFPAEISDLVNKMPVSFDGLVKAYPYIQAQKLIECVPDDPNPRTCNHSKSRELFIQHGVSFPSNLSWPKRFRRRLTGRASKDQQGSPVFKTPLIKRTPESFQVGSHNSSLPPSSSVLLSIAHFVFTEQSCAKAKRAIRERAHANDSRKYHGYAQLFERMKGSSATFLDELSVKYSDADQLIRLGLMKW